MAKITFKLNKSLAKKARVRKSATATAVKRMTIIHGKWVEDINWKPSEPVTTPMMVITLEPTAKRLQTALRGVWRMTSLNLTGGASAVSLK